jgi:hypothetical protein
MPEYQPLDLRLRYHTKRKDLPVDVMRDIGYAYELCFDLERAQNEIKKLKQERDDAYAKIDMLQKTVSNYAMDYLAQLDEELGLNDLTSEANYNNDLFRKTDME